MKRIITVILGTLLLPALSFANHSWNDYHWARNSASFNLTLINSTTSDWDPYVAQAVLDWSASTKVNLVQDLTGSSNTKERRQCRSIEGQLRICNLAYGNNGWLGIAGISIDSSGHITTGYTKLNDSYFADPFYDNAWKQSVTCQELGHNLGLAHQDENFNNASLFSCMDYQSPPFEYPNNHDYDQLVNIYTHLDSYNSYSGAGGGSEPSVCNAPPGKGCNKVGANNDVGWGMSIGRRGNAETFIRIDNKGVRHLTHVTWAMGH